MFCPNCGTQNTETAQACTKCGFALKSAAAPKFKGTMLMMNQPGMAPRPPAVGPTAPAAPAAPAAPSSGAPFTAEAPPIGAGAPSAGAAPGAPSRLKGTIVGVAPPNIGGSAPPPPHGAPMNAPPPGEQQSFGSPGVNPLGGTMALDAGGFPQFNPPPAGGAPSPYGAPPAPDAFGAPPPAPDAFGAPPPAPVGHGPYGAPPAPVGPGAYGAPPADAFGGPPPGGAPNPYGAPPADPYGAPAGGGFGGPPPGGAPNPYGAPHGQHGQHGQSGPQDFGGQVQQGFNQMGQAFNEFGQAVNQGMQPYQGGAPMMGAQPPGAMVAGGKPWMVTLLLCAFGGGLGIHRFYTGHTGIGIAQLLTGGGCGIWALYDLIMILTGKYTDKEGRPLVKE